MFAFRFINSATTPFFCSRKVCFAQQLGVGFSPDLRSKNRSENRSFMRNLKSAGFSFSHNKYTKVYNRDTNIFTGHAGKKKSKELKILIFPLLIGKAASLQKACV